MNNTLLEIEEAKAYLTNSSVARKIIFEEKYRENKKEPKYPKRFWKISVYQHVYDLDNIKRPEKDDWIINDVFYTKDIENAIAHAILKTRSDETFEEVTDPELKYWFRRKIEYIETVRYRKGDIRYGSYFNVYDILNPEKEFKSYDQSFGFRKYTLINIPVIITKLSEEIPFGFSTVEVEEISPIDRYPYFLYESNLYKSTYYIHDQKCICGDPVGHKNHREEGLKIEIWNVDRFMKKNIIYIFDDFIYFNGTIKKYLKKSEEELKALYPSAEGVDSIFAFSKFR